MRTAVTYALLCSTLALFPARFAEASASVGQPAPTFTSIDSRGETVKLSDYAGKHVVLEWTNHGCPFVQKHYNTGNMQALQEAATTKGVVWLSIISSAAGKQGHVSGDEADELTSSRNAHPTAVLLDESGDIGRLYGAKTTPHMFIVDPEGTLIYAGGIDSIPSADTADVAKAVPYVKLALNEALEGVPVSEATTRPYGCSVKY